MTGLSIRGTEAYVAPMAVQADNEVAERMPDNEAAESFTPSPQVQAPLRSTEGSLLDLQA